ncbi:hypothetical protein [Inhella proteolytica]|nr:hypothetical protein [Inhella proteolytica]
MFPRACHPISRGVAQTPRVAARMNSTLQTGDRCGRPTDAHS